MSKGESGLSASEKRGILLPVCLICGETPPGGLASGVFVSGAFLCTLCEREIVNARVGDSSYTQLKEKVKRIWARRKA